MSLPLERWCVSVEPRTKKIDAELKEKLAPFGATRSARFRFAYDLAFTIICEGCTIAKLQAVVDTLQRLNGITSSYKIPVPLSKAGEGGSGPVSSGKDMIGPLKCSVVNHRYLVVSVHQEVEEACGLLSARNARVEDGSTSLRSRTLVPRYEMFILGAP